MLDFPASSSQTISRALQPPELLAGRWLGGALLLSIAAVAVLMAGAGLVVSPLRLDDLPYYVCGIVALGLRQRLLRSPRRMGQAIADCAEWYAVLTLVSLLGAVSSYPLAADSHGFVDASLARIDRLLHFDWIGWYRVVAAHPLLQLAGRIAYQSIYFTPALMLATFAWTGQRARARAFLLAYWLAAIVTLALFRFMPALGPLAFLWHGAIPYMPESALWQPVLIPPLRQHMLHVVDIGALRGLVSAPSFHTEAAILYILSAWPHRGLRWPVTVVNVAMLLATPVEGTHYLADMLVGALVAGAAWLVTLGVQALSLRPPAIAEPPLRR